MIEVKPKEIKEERSTTKQAELVLESAVENYLIISRSKAYEALLDDEQITKVVKAEYTE